MIEGDGPGCSTADPEAVEQSANDDPASLLDALLSADQQRPGSAASILRSVPEDVRAELDHLLDLARQLRAVRPVELAPVVKRRLRARIMAAITRRDR